MVEMGGGRWVRWVGGRWLRWMAKDVVERGYGRWLRWAAEDGRGGWRKMVEIRSGDRCWNGRWLRWVADVVEMRGGRWLR
jgi:hypothetical protein